MVNTSGRLGAAVVDLYESNKFYFLRKCLCVDHSPQNGAIKSSLQNLAIFVEDDF